VMTVGGLALSYAWDLPSGPAIVLLGGAMLVLAEGWQRVARSARSDGSDTAGQAPAPTRSASP
jgi:hypothetical protein